MPCVPLQFIERVRERARAGNQQCRQLETSLFLFAANIIFDLMRSIVVERLVEHIKQAYFSIMVRPRMEMQELFALEVLIVTLHALHACCCHLLMNCSAYDFCGLGQITTTADNTSLVAALQLSVLVRQCTNKCHAAASDPGPRPSRSAQRCGTSV